MFYAKHRSRRKKMKFVKGIAMLLCLVTIFTSVWVGNLGIGAEDGDDKVTVTVKYVYKSNGYMVTQPYTAQISKGTDFTKTIEIPHLLNYTIPVDDAIVSVGSDEMLLQGYAGISLNEKDSTISFDLKAVTEDVAVTLYYVAGKGKYTVNHYRQNLENDEYTLDRSDIVVNGDIDAYTEAVADIVPGYHCKGVEQSTIAADGTTKVDIYYDRDFYTVVFDVNGGVNGPKPIYAKFGTTFEANEIEEPTRKGYTFLGWSPVLSDTVTIEKNITYVAQWQAEKGQADYTIVLWGQNANDDEYSYLSSHEAWGNVGNQVTWNEGTLISHAHTEECGSRYCKKEEHTHDAGCGLICSHIHGLVCYGLSSSVSSTNPDSNTAWWNSNKPEEYFEKLGLENGYIYYDDENALWASKDLYYLYLNNKFYLLSESLFNNLKGILIGSLSDDASRHKDYYYKYSVNMNSLVCDHSHSDECYNCGKVAHTHSAYCCDLSDTPKKYMRDIKPDDKLWVYEKSETVTVNADGSTVLNVYFKRVEFTLNFRNRNSNSNDYGTIKARWGKDISVEYQAIVAKANTSFWSRNRNGSQPWTNYIGIMPQENIDYYKGNTSGSGQSTMTYYGELPDGTYDKIFSLTFTGTRYTVSDEDRYQFEGYTYDHGTANGENCNGAEFYYRRNNYNLEFYSASKSIADKFEKVKYQNPLGGYDYTPVNKPDTVENDAVFVGWYLNPECTGEKYDLSAHTMPAHDIALYAKWVNGLYTVTTYTDESKSELYKYEGYEGVQTNIVKYTLAEAPKDPDKSGYVFAGWFYNDGEKEEPFSFTMPITRNYNLYPKFTDQVMVNYTVHYYIENSTTKVADDDVGQARIGSSVTIKAKMGTELYSGMQNNFFPNLTSTSVTIEKDNQEIIIYYRAAQEVEYTVKYQDKNGKDLIQSVKKKTKDAIVTEKYVPIPNYAPRQNSIRFELKAEGNVIVFIYDPTLTTLNIHKTGFDAADAGTTFIFRIKGTDENTKNIDLRVTIHGYVSGGDVPNVTVADLPVGSYTVTEESDWSWRYQPTNGEQPITLDPDGTKNVLTFENVREDDKWLSGDAYNNNLYKPDSN